MTSIEGTAIPTASRRTKSASALLSHAISGNPAAKYSGEYLAF